MEETNMSVPKADAPENNNDSNASNQNNGAKGKLKQLGKTAAVGGAKTGGSAVAGQAATNAAATLGGKAINSVAAMLSKAADVVVTGATKLFSPLVHGVTTIANGVTSFFGGAVSAASSFFATAATFITVGATAVAGVSSTGTNPAIINDFPIHEDDCRTNSTGAGASGEGVQISTAEQQRNAYIIYNTIYTWLSENGSANAENQAYGFLANVLRESGYNPASLEDKSVIDGTDYESLTNYHHGIGLVQWTNYKPSQNPKETWKSYALATFFQTNSMPWDALDSQLKILISGNDPCYGDMLTYIANSGSMSATECDIEFLKVYEKPAQEYVIQRTNEAAEDIATVQTDVSHYISTNPTDDIALVTDILTYAADLTSGSGDGSGLASFESNINCYPISKYDNSSIAKAAVSFAWEHEADSHNDGTAMYIKVCNVVHATKADIHYRACDRCVSAAVAWSGSDDEIAACSGVEGIYSHISTSDKWQSVGKVEFGADGFPSNCEPGDILVVTAAEKGSEHGHILLYVGNETIKEFYPDADDSLNIVSASLNERSAACGTFKQSDGNAKYSVFRCINPDNSETYKNAGQ